MVSTGAVTETQFAEDFRKLIEQEGDPALRALRERAYAYFAEHGFPTVTYEDWKYTNVAEIAKQEWPAGRFGCEMPALNVDVRAIVERFGLQRHGFTALNLAFAEFAVVRIPRETVIAEPIEFDFSAPAGEAAFPHVIVIAEAGSKATLVGVYESTGRSFTDTAVQIIVEDNANLT